MRQKERFLSNPETNEQFINSRDEIQRILNKTEFFHGTGAKHYKNLGNSKNDGCSGEHNDSLHTIMENGLEAREDLFNEDFETGAEATISLTKQRIYARLYACLFLYENERLDYEYGRREYWWFQLLGRMVFTALSDIDFVKQQAKQVIKGAANVFDPENRGRKKLKKERKKQQYNQWIQSFRQDGKYKPWRAVFHGTSDIEGNFPMILGIEPGAVKPVLSKHKSVNIYETRSAEGIPSSSFTHIQVPAGRIIEVRERIQQLCPDLPVIPIEFVELINSETPLSELVKPDPDINQ